MASPFGEITLSLRILLMLITASVCVGREFIVSGGRSGWTWTVPDKPLQGFLINDTLVFSYDINVDAVLRVRDSQYTACNTTDPLINGGKSRLVLESLGCYYFISADALRCQVGERLIVFVNPAPNNTPSAPLPPPPKPASSSSPPPPPPPKPVSTTLSSSAVDLRAGVLACLHVIGASAAIL